MPDQPLDYETDEDCADLFPPDSETWDIAWEAGQWNSHPDPDYVPRDYPASHLHESIYDAISPRTKVLCPVCYRDEASCECAAQALEETT